MSTKIAYQEQANGLAYTLHETTIIFPYGDLSPRLVMVIHGAAFPITIATPERFGSWRTARARRAYVRAFVAAAAQQRREEA